MAPSSSMSMQNTKRPRFSCGCSKPTALCLCGRAGSMQDRVSFRENGTLAESIFLAPFEFENCSMGHRDQVSARLHREKFEPRVSHHTPLTT